MNLSNLKSFVTSVFLAVAALTQGALVADEAPNKALLREQPYAPVVAQTLTMQGKGIPWAHEINVVLPAGSSITQWGTQRTADLFPPDGNALLYTADEDDPAVQLAKKRGIDYGVLMKNAHADKFLDFLVDEVRPALAKKYRMADDHALLGHSAGGGFTAYSVFKRPGDFDRYFIGSGTGAVALEMEKAYAKSHDDLDARIFIGAGDIESSGLFGASQRLATNPMRLGENLLLRQYPSLDLEIAVYRNKGHITVLPLSFSEGLIFLYEDLLTQ